MKNNRKAELALKKILENSTDSHNVFTPFELCERMSNSILKESFKNILVIANLEFVYLLKQNVNVNKIWFTTTCDIKQAVAINLGIDKNHIIRFEYKDKQLFKTDMKFDVIISNPPYQDGKHMTFLNHAYNSLNENGTLIFLQPSTYFVSLLGPLLRKNNRIKFPEKEIQSLELLSRKTFGEFADLYVPLSIIKIKKGTDNSKIKVKYEGTEEFEEFEELSNVNVFGNIPEVFSLIKKFKNEDCILNHVIKEKNKFNWFVELSRIRGDRDVNNIIVSKSTIPTKEIKHNFNWQTFGFSSEIEANNFISYLRTNFSRKLLELLKLGQHLDRGELTLIPWIDFTKEWTDEEIFGHFKLSDNEIDFINTVKKYY